MRWRELAAELGVPIRLRAATAPAALADLFPGEQAQAPDGPRRHDWLLGRAALKQLLGGADTSAVRFPNRCVSLTHGSGLAVAARAGGNQVGVGVDYEGPRAPDPRTGRFFLREREWQPPVDLLRLWTVKEALFKATPGNGGAVLLDYEVADPGALDGKATDEADRTFRYASRRLYQGWLTVAVCDAPV